MKMIKKRLGIGAALVLVLSLGLGACSSEPAIKQEKDKGKEQAAATQKAAEEKAAREKEEAEAKQKAKEEAAAKEKEKAKEQERKEAAALQLMQNSFEGNMDIKFDKEAKMFTLTPTDPGFSIELSQMLSGTKSNTDWNNFTESMSELSKSVSSTLGDKYSVSVANPVNADNVLLVIMDGTVIYDAFNK